MKSASLEECFISGTMLVQGAAWGAPFFVEREDVQDFSSETECGTSSFEIERLKKARFVVECQLLKLRDDFLRGRLKDEADIVSVELALLKDATLFVEVISQIEQHHVSVERAIFLAKAHMKSLFSLFPVQSNRTFELLEDVFIRLLAELKVHAPALVTLSRENQQTILVVEMLWPSRATELLHQGFAGIVTKQGGRMSHAVLLARSKGIPFITNIRPEDWDSIVHANILLIDGEMSRVLLNPIQSVLESKSCKGAQSKTVVGSLKKHRRCTTQDGRSISLLASIEYSEDAQIDEMNIASGIGLYRSEYLIQEIGYVPHEEEQIAAFSHLVELAGTRPVIIRTFDFSGDKQWVSLDSQGASFQTHSRSLSELLDNPSLFFPHMRAIVRAGELGSVSVLFPMVSSLSDFRRCRSLIEAAQLSVASEGKVCSKIKVGAMVELPSIICQLPDLLKEVDFISLGTNDLLQYCLAVNRLGAISCDSSLYLHEGFLSLCGYIAKTCKKAKKPCMVCGEMPTDLGMLMVLVGLGFSSFTLPLSLMMEAKKMLTRLDTTCAKNWVDTLLALPSQEERFQWLETWKKTYG